MKQKLDPKAVWFLFFLFVLVWLFIVLPVIIFIFWKGVNINFWNFLWRFSFTILLLIFGFIWAKLTYHFYYYELTESAFQKESGIIFKKYVTIPYNKIQNIKIQRDLLKRIFGLSDLYIYTAAEKESSEDEGTLTEVIFERIHSERILPYLSKETAEQLRDEILRRVSQLKNQEI
jgi:putative membrane protein